MTDTAANVETGAGGALPSASDLYRKFLMEGVEHLKAGRTGEGMEIIDRCLAADPGNSGASFLLGTAFTATNRFGCAIALLSQAVTADPENDGAWHNLGVALRRAEHYDEAIEALRRAIKIDPKRQDTLAMLAGAYVNQGNPMPGIAWGRKAVKINPDDPHANNNLALCLLEAGEFEEGWKYYERRWEIPERHPRDYGSIPKWDGKSHVGTLSIHGEQGLGDELLFLTLLEEVRPFADEIIIECASRLVQTVERSTGCRCYPTHESLIAIEAPDAWIPMGDLPRLFRNRKEDFKRQKPYLKADPERVKYWRKRMEETGPGPYIGYAWAGGAPNTHQALRCVTLDQWTPIFERKGTFICLQYGVDEAPHNLWKEAIDDLDEFAALVSACDVVVSVCQTAVHFAGALGKDTLCLTPKRVAWRYGASGDMLWYPSVNLIRQKEDGKWSGVIRNVCDELDKRAVSGAEPAAA